MDQRAQARPGSGEETVLPPSDVSLLGEIEAFLETHSNETSLIAADGATTAIPEQVYDALRRVVDALAHGSAVTVSPVSTRLTTSQAAEILGVSRPTVVRLLEDGVIPYEQPRRHRLLRLDDVLAYKARRKAETRAVLAELTRTAVEDGLYDQSYEDYVEALAEARHNRRV
jgi:excisionase family DNA binding protein